jgi:hypothetical protein
MSQRKEHMGIASQMTDVDDAALRDAILAPLAAYNTQQTGTTDHRPLVVIVVDDTGQVVGGLWGRKYWAPLRALHSGR